MAFWFKLEAVLFHVFQQYSKTVLEVLRTRAAMPRIFGAREDFWRADFKRKISASYLQNYDCDYDD